MEVAKLGVFQSTLPARGATAHSGKFRGAPEDFNPRSPHGERPPPPATTTVENAYFNPRSPHGERQRQQGLFRAGGDFNPRSPHGERQLRRTNGGRWKPFQSTLPARGATQSARNTASVRRISIHAPRTGSDAQSAAEGLADPQFQSTLPARGATKMTKRNH